jgi:hypothetical protein
MKPGVLRISVTACLILFPLSGMAEENAFTNFSQEWTKCQTDDQCVITKGACGEPRSVNKNYKIPFEQHQAHLAGAVECLSPQTYSDTISAACVKGICSVRK